jgi:hypothetical protein
MTLIELIYFVVTGDSAFFLARWVYFQVGLVLAVFTFLFLWIPCIRFFFTGRFTKLIDSFRQSSKSKDSN